MVKKQNCVIDTNSFIVYVRTDFIYQDTVEGVQTSFHTLSYKISRPLHKRKNQIVIELMKDELEKLPRSVALKLKAL